MKLQKFAWLGLVLSAMVATACEETVIPPEPDPPITLALSPDEVSITVGQTAQLVAVVSGGNAQTVRTATCTSSNTAVATVNAQTCVVTGVTAGQAQITARATADNNAADASNIIVTPVITQAPPTISIARVTFGNTNTPVNIANVFGQIEIVVNLENPDNAPIQRVEWLIDQTVVFTQNFSGSAADVAAGADEAQAAVELVASVNTAAFNATTGAVSFPNGPHTVSARVVGPQGTVVATAPPSSFSQLIFNNLNAIVLTVTSTGTPATAVAGNGLVWNGGPLSTTGLPVIYTPGATVNSVTFSVNDDAAGGSGVGTVSITDTSSPFSASFPTSGSNNIAGFEDAGTVVSAAAVVNNQQGPINTSTIRLDVKAPVVTGGGANTGELTFPNPALPWIGPNVSISSLVATPGFTATDGGVGGVTKVVQWKDAAAATSAFATVAAIGDLAETATNASLDFRGRACDALNNCQNTAPTQDGGVDKTAPVMTIIAPTPANNGANDGSAYSATCVDNSTPPAGPSGCFLPNALLVKAERLRPAGTTCMNVNTGAALSNCNNPFIASPLSYDFNVPAASGGTEGYWRVTEKALDNARNETAEQVRLTLLDVVAPVLGGVSSPSTITGNASATFNSDASDNNDLGDARGVINFGGLVHLQAGASTLGAYGPDAFTTSAQVAVTVNNFIRSIENGLGGGITQANAMTVLLRDQAGVVDSDACPNMVSPNTSTQNCANRQVDISAAVAAGITAANPQTAWGATGMATWLNGAPSATTVCNGDNAGGTQTNPCPTNPSSTTLSVVATGPDAGAQSNFFNVPQRVNFYYNLNGLFGTTVSILIGTATTPSSVSDTGGVRTATWTVTWTPAGLAAGSYSFFAVAVDSKGQGLVDGSTVITVAIN